MRRKRLQCFVFFLFGLAFLFSACGEQKESTKDNTSLETVGSRRDYLAVDLGELPASYRLFFPADNVSKKIVGLTSIFLAEVVSDVTIQESVVYLTVLPVISQLGTSLSGETVLRNIEAAYLENQDHFSAEIVESAVDGLTLHLVFDKPVDFEREFFSLPIYPLSALTGENSDSYGTYMVVEERVEPSVELELYSNTAHSNKKIILSHYRFDSAKQKFEDGLLDVLCIPKEYSANNWAEASSAGEVVDVTEGFVYMLGFGDDVLPEQKEAVRNAFSQREFIEECLQGFASFSYYPLEQNLFDDREELVDKEAGAEVGDVTSTEPGEQMVLEYVCFVDADWSYDFCQYITSRLEMNGIVLRVLYTDFENMMRLREERSDFLYAFAWDYEAGSDLSLLLGEEFDGQALDEDEVARYLASLPVLPIAEPFERYLVVNGLDASFILDK